MLSLSMLVFRIVAVALCRTHVYDIQYILLIIVCNTLIYIYVHLYVIKIQDWCFVVIQEQEIIREATVYWLYRIIKFCVHVF